MTKQKHKLLWTKDIVMILNSEERDLSSILFDQ